MRRLLLIVGFSVVLASPARAQAPDSLQDAVMVLQTLAGLSPGGVAAVDDINADGNIGLAEAIYALRQVVTGPDRFGEVHAGMYHLGPVDFAETMWHNACAPGGGYRSELRQCTGLGGEYLAGVSSQYNQGGGVCDTCIAIDTAAGHHIVARVVTYGATNDPGDIDVSPSVYAAINEGEWPRDMTWQLVKCPDFSPIRYEFQTGANIWWTSLWVRNARVPIAELAVKSANHSEFAPLQRGGDGTFTDNHGFGSGPFTLRVTGVDGQVIEDDFDGFTPGEIVTSAGQFQ